MLTYSRQLQLTVAAIFLFAVPALAQDQQVCISQAAANQCAANARELVALKEKIAVLEAALVEKDKNADVIRQAAAKNEADLKASLHRTEVELATKTGQLIATEAATVRLSAIIDFLLKNGRIKKYGAINF